jgi:hypothetical protein
MEERIVNYLHSPEPSAPMDTAELSVVERHGPRLAAARNFTGREEPR